MAKDAVAAGFVHLLLPGLQTVFLAVTVVAVAAAAVALLCCLNWDSAVFDGLTSGEKITNALFMAVNARQAGENSVDCSLVAPAVLVLFLSMMSASRSFSPHDCDLVFRQTRQPIGDKILRTLFRCIPATATFFSVHDGSVAVVDEGSGGEPEPNKHGAAKKRRSLSVNSMFLTPLACVAAVTMLVCVTERRSLSGDPLNFSTFNMIFEVLR
jgi:hypothetical protein